MSEFIALKSKSYCYTMFVNKKDKKFKQFNQKGKGVPKSSLKKMTMDNYKQALYGNERDELIQNLEYKSFKSKNHEISTINNNKITLSAFDDKRLIDVDRMHTFAVGYNPL